MAMIGNDSGSKAASEQSVKLIHNLQHIRFVEVGPIVAATWLAIFLVRRVVPYLAERGPSQMRLCLPATVPVVRLVLPVLAILWIVPLIFNITFQSFLVIAGAASAYLDCARPIVVVLAKKPWGTHHKLRACPFDMRDQFAFARGLTMCGKQAIFEAGAREATAWAVNTPPV